MTDPTAPGSAAYNALALAGAKRQVYPDAMPYNPGDCPLPAVASWTTYPRSNADDADLSGMKSFPYCRFHEQPARARAEKHAAAQKTPYYAHKAGPYERGQADIVCSSAANPLELGAVLDKERIDEIRRGAQVEIEALTYLTTNARGVSAEVGNECAVIEGLRDVAAAVEYEVGVVVRRLAQRTSWAKVGECLGMSRQSAHERWGPA